MASKPKSRLLRSSYEGLFENTLGDKEYIGKGKSTRASPLNGSSMNDDFFLKLAEEAERETADIEESDVSEADPRDVLKNMKDMDDMDADLFGSKKKPTSAPPQAKRFGRGGANTEPSGSESTAKPRGAEGSTVDKKKPSSAPSSTTQGYRKFDFSDDPLSDLLGDLNLEETKEEPKETPTEKPLPSLLVSPIVKTKEPAMAPKRREELTFDDDEDNLIDALGFDSDKEMIPKKKETGYQRISEPPQRARTRLDEILGRGTSPRLLERPPTGERKDPPKQPIGSQERDKQASSKDPLLEEDLASTSYQPTLGSTPEGRQSRRQSVRFSTDDISSSTPERQQKPTSLAPTTTPNSAPNPALTLTRSSADWLGLKSGERFDFLDEDVKEPKSLPETPKTATSSAPERRPSPSGGPSAATEEAAAEPTDPASTSASKPLKTEATGSQRKGEEEEDWLSGALSKKKGLERRRSRQEESLGLREDVDIDAIFSKPSATTRNGEENMFTPTKESIHVSTAGARTTPVRDHSDTRGTQQTPTQTPPPAAQQQVTLSTENLQQLLLQRLMQSQLLGLGGTLDLGFLQKQKKEQQLGDHQALQAHILHLEGQVRSLQLDRDHSQMLLESVQQRHKQDMDLMENAHKARVKLLEDSWSQREARARQEYEDLLERLAEATRSAEQERGELQTQHQRRLAQSQQERDREVQRLRDLQGKSILEMKKDHEQQIQRLKRLKDEEIDAVTSATSQTRSLTGVIEQMEDVSSRLGELSCRVESTHEHTAQGLEQGARLREEQLRVMQESLGQQQRATSEERTRLKEVITRMEVQLAEQQRQLEKERWRVTVEQAKAESAQRVLDEERRTLKQHVTLEREELERAKSALLEEQQSVMQHCAEERRKMAAEWAQFHAADKQRQERAERESSRHLERDAHAHSSIISMAQEQADLKLRSGELKQREEALARERESLDRQREDVDREKESISATALRLKSRAQEVEAFSKLATERFEEGEQALYQAKGVESEHQARLRSIHTQMDRLRQQEQRLLQEKVRVSNMRREMERMKLGLPTASLRSIIPPMCSDFSLMVPNPELSIAPPTSTPDPSSSELQARLALLRHTAEKDRVYLQDEQFFLDTLRKAPKSAAFQTD